MNLFNIIKEKIKVICREELASDLQNDAGWFDAVTVEPPKDASYGEMATNAAMVLAKKAKMSPRDLASKLIIKINGLEEVSNASVAGPGFINVALHSKYWQQQIETILTQDIAYGTIRNHTRPKVNVEYVSANPTGPMHIGHARGAVVGDALARLLSKAGYDVTKEYYINDAGAQIETLAHSAHLRYREACGETIETIPEGLYPGEYLKPVGETIKSKYNNTLIEMSESEWMPLVKAEAIKQMMELIKQDLADLGVTHDVFTSEKSLHDADKITEVLESLKTKGLVYTGILEPPKGQTPEDWEPREQVLFKTTDYGDDTDRPLAKSDGSWTYFAADVAYANNKLERGFNHQILILGADHGGYVKRMEAAVGALSENSAQVTIQLCQLVKFMENGQPIKMSKRAGTFTTVRDVLEAVGRDVIRFIMLTRKPEQPLDFDLTKVTEQSRDNPVWYVQYAHARCYSILRMAEEQMPKAVEASLNPTLEQLVLLNAEEEKQLIRKLCEWPRLVEVAAEAKEPHRVAYFLQDVAATFHGFWNKGNENISLRFIQKDAIDKSIARMALARAVATIIASGLDILGVDPIEEMR